MKFARSPLPSLAQLKKMRDWAFFDGMASAFDIMPVSRPPINLDIPIMEVLRSDFMTVADDFAKALEVVLEEEKQRNPAEDGDD